MENDLRPLSLAIKTMHSKIESLFRDNFSFLRNECISAIPTIDNNLV